MGGIVRNFNPFRVALDPLGFTDDGHDALGIINPKLPEALPTPDSAPVPESPTPMPLPTPLRDDAAARTVKRRSIAAQQRRRGRQSTILTALNAEDEGRLGG